MQKKERPAPTLNERKEEVTRLIKNDVFFTTIKKMYICH